jgi:hypothetical protein
MKASRHAPLFSVSNFDFSLFIVARRIMPRKALVRIEGSKRSREGLLMVGFVLWTLTSLSFFVPGLACAVLSKGLFIKVPK